MKSFAFFLLISLGLLMMITTTRAAVARAVSLQEAVATALRQNPSLLAAAEDLAMAQARVGMSRAATKPALSTSSIFSTGDMAGTLTSTAPVMPAAILNTPGATALRQNLMLMLPLSTGGRLRESIREANAQQLASSADLNSLRQEVALQTKLNYRQTLFAGKMVGIYEDLVKQTEERLRIDQLAYDVGKIPLYYLLRDKTELSNAQQMLTNAKRDEAIAFVDLKTVMGLEPTMEISLTDALTYQSVSVSLDSLQFQAEKSRPELTAIRERISAAQARLDSARSAYRPQVSFSAMADLQQSSGMGFDKGYTLAVVGSLPLSDGGMRRSAVAEVEADLRRLTREEGRIKLQVNNELRKTTLSLGAADKNVHTSEVALTQAEEDHRVAQLRYTAGKGVIVEVLDSLVALTRARTNHAQALLELNIANDKLERAIGRAVKP